LTKAIINVIPVLSEEMLVKVVKSFSQVKRGSNTLWDFFTKKVNERFENMNGEQLVTLLFAMQNSEFNEKQLTERLVNEIFQGDMLENSTFELNEFTWFNILLVLVMNKNLNSQYIEKYERRLEQLWNNFNNPIIKILILEEYTKRGMTSEILQDKFDELATEIEVMYKKLVAQNES